MRARNTPHRHRRTGAPLAAAAALALGAGLALPAQAAATDSPTGPVVNAGAAEAVPGSYVVTLNEARAASVSADSLAAQYDADVERTYEHALTGFEVSASADAAARLAADPAVERVEQNTELSLTTETQDDPPSWGLDRIDQPDLPLDGSMTYPAHGGEGVTVYVVDTGVHYTHDDFGGRATPGYDDFGGDGSDDNGHGTHVAGTAAGASYGVAKEADIVSVKVLNSFGSGTMAGIVAGVDWLTGDADGPAVANMSLGGLATPTLDDAVASSVAAGVTHAVAAGNDGADAGNYSPARAPEALTVASSNSSDARSSFSNHGTAVNIFAPGEQITGPWHTGDSAENTISGTSMASPHVAGAAALFLAEQPDATPAEVGDALDAQAVGDRISDPRAGTPNQLLQLSTAGEPDEPDEPGEPGDGEPVAVFTEACLPLLAVCFFDASESHAPDSTITHYAWEFGDGATGEGVQPVHFFNGAGSYEVALTVTDEQGATGTASRTVNAS